MENLLEQIVKTRMKHAFGNANTIGKETSTGKMFTGKAELLESILEEWEVVKAQMSESNCTIDSVSNKRELLISFMMMREGHSIDSKDIELIDAFLEGRINS